MQTEFSLQSGAHFADPIFQKVLRGWQIFLTSWSANRALASPAHFLSTTFPDRGRQPRKQRPYFGDPWMRVTRQNTRFCARERFHPFMHTLPTVSLLYCYHARAALANYVVDMMMMMMTTTTTLWRYDIMTLWHYDIMTIWHYDIMTLWHYDKTAPGHSSVTPKFSN